MGSLPAPVLVRLARAAGVSVSWLATGEGPMAAEGGALDGADDENAPFDEGAGPNAERIRFSERLASVLSGESARSLARKAGLSETAIRKYLSAESTPNVERLIAIAQACGTTVQWRATGKGPMRPEESSEPDAGAEASAGDEYALVPVYDVRAAAGHGSVFEEERVMDSLMFNREWLQNELHADPSDLCLVHVDGDSMDPTLRAGGIVLADLRKAVDIVSDGIYVLRMDGTLLVKRLQRRPANRVRVISDNPAYEPFEIDLKELEGEVVIVGRVVWDGRRM